MASSKAGSRLIPPKKANHQVLTSPKHLLVDPGHVVAGSHTDSSLQIPPRPSLEVPATHFTLFPRLPIELRLLIWNYAMPGPRIVDSYWHEWYNGMALMMELSPWAIINACHESRDEALKRYRVRLTDVREHEVADDAWPMLIDPVRDTVVLPINLSTEVDHEEIDSFADMFNDVQHLAINAVRGHQDEIASLEWLTRLPAVRTLTVIIHGQRCSKLRSMDCGLRTFTPIPEGETVAQDEHLEECNKVLDKMAENNLDWTRPKLRVVCVEMDGTRCCDLNPHVTRHRHRPPVRRSGGWRYGTRGRR
jgi:hypothetical protein